MVQILVVRHGQTDYNQRRILQGHFNSTLNQEGFSQSKQLGRWLKSQGVVVDACWSSDLQRCRSTTECILGELHGEIASSNSSGDSSSDGEDHILKRVVYTEDLRERSLGELEQMHWDMALAKAKSEGKSFSDYGESHGVLVKRIAKVWPVLLAECEANNYQTVLLVSHGGYIANLTKYLINNGLAVVSESIPVDAIRHPPNTSITTIEVPTAGGNDRPTSISKSKHHKVPKGVITTFSYVPHLLDKNTINFKDGQ